MDMLRVHSDARHSSNAHYHVFLARYSNTKRVVYGFVEGQQDPCCYQTWIEQCLPDEWNVELWPVKGKDAVYRTYSRFDWHRFSKRRVGFFVDRDFSEVVPGERPGDVNIYVTDDYSIENSLVSAATCRRALTEVVGFTDVDHDELDDVCARFEKEYDRFLKTMIPVTAWLLSQQRNGRVVHYGNVDMKHLFRLAKGRLQVKRRPGGCGGIRLYLESRCQVASKQVGAGSTKETEREITENGLYRRLVRGKFGLVSRICGYVEAPAGRQVCDTKRLPRAAPSRRQTPSASAADSI